MILSHGTESATLDGKRYATASKTKRFQPAKRDLSLFWMSQCVACHPAGQILYHVTVSCKGPSVQKSKGTLRDAYLHLITCVSRGPICFWTTIAAKQQRQFRFGDAMTSS